MFLGITPFDIIIILAIIILIILVPIVIKSRIINSIARYVFELEEMVQNSKELLKKVCVEQGKPDTDPTDAINDFMEFFIVPPVDLDATGIMEKFERIIEMGEERFRDMIDMIAPNADNEWKSNLTMTLKATVGINNVAKNIRHNLELTKKTGNLQILFTLQMGLPMIMRIIRAQYNGLHAFSEGKPIGDGLGPLVAGMLMTNVPEDEMKETNDILIGRTVIENRDIIIARAKGPGARIGRPGRTVKNLIEKENINRLITVDAAQKLEGEETGAVAQGVGVVVGGPGVDKWILEGEMVKNNIALDAIIVKMSPEESIQQMMPILLKSAAKTVGIIQRSILQSKPGSKILVLGVGNSCGIPNIVKDISKIDIKEDIEKGKRGQ